MNELEELVEAAEPNPLLRLVDGLCASRSWDELVELARKCVEAGERGKQLWPIAEHIDYRLALEAPGPHAGAVLKPGSGRFALGPLTEVAASTHKFEEVSQFISSPQAASVFAAERVVRGEDLTKHSGEFEDVLELPLTLQSWEPQYPLATYKAHEAEFADPVMPDTPFDEMSGSPATRIDDPELESALLDLVSVWVSDSNAVASAAVVEGEFPGAIAATGSTDFLAREIGSAEAFGLMAWAAASGGAHGRRRGAAFGRFGAWSTAAALTDLRWPPDPHELLDEIGRLLWIEFRPKRVETGWNLHLAVASASEDWSAVISAVDLSD